VKGMGLGSPSLDKGCDVCFVGINVFDSGDMKKTEILQIPITFHIIWNAKPMSFSSQ
jgi:hypothetical protein